MHLPRKLLLLACLSLPAGAQTKEAAKVAPMPCAYGSGSALSELACELRRGLPDLGGRALVVSAPPTASGSIRPEPSLGVRLAKLVAGRVSSDTRAHERVEELAAARSLARGGSALVYVALKLDGDRLTATADVYPSARSLWQRVRQPRPEAFAHAFAERPLDAEVRSFLPPIPIVVGRVTKATGTDADAVALACGDVDADGSHELAVLGRRRVVLGRVRAARFEGFRERLLSELSPVAGAPLREPIASAWIPEPGVLELGITDRESALRLDGKLDKREKLDGRVPWPGGGCLAAQGRALAPLFRPCRAGDEKRAALSRDALDAVAGSVVIAKTGAARVVRAFRPAGSATAHVVDGAVTHSLEGAGAQLSLGDLDGDGTPELVTSRDTRDPKADELVVSSVEAARLTERLRLPVPSGVHAIAVCPGRADRMAPVALLAGDGLWVIE
jgi:hypothetical protein